MKSSSPKVDLGSLLEELVHKLARLPEVSQLVEVTLILRVRRGDHLGVFIGIREGMLTLSRTAPGSKMTFLTMTRLRALVAAEGGKARGPLAPGLSPEQAPGGCY